ncbi:hypothetical protein LXL04_037833 [Taraxacum kok-saghyz]
MTTEILMGYVAWLELFYRLLRNSNSLVMCETIIGWIFSWVMCGRFPSFRRWPCAPILLFTGCLPCVAVQLVVFNVLCVGWSA